MMFVSMMFVKIMLNKTKRLWLLLLILTLLLTLPAHARAADSAELNKAAEKAAAYILQNVPAPSVDSVGGEWAVLGLSRGSANVPREYFTAYYARVEAYVRQHQGILHQQKHTEYARVILALTAAGYDARRVGGYDLTLPLGDFEQTVWQGINGPIWALLAVDSGGYPMPQNPQAPTQATRQMYIEEILRRQLTDGGWSLGAASAVSSDPDLTGMALQALAKYQEQPEVAAAIAKALTCLSALQDENGGFRGWGEASPESAVQVLVALCELGLPIDDGRFTKNGRTLVDNILTFQNADGGFRHQADIGASDLMSSEQALYGLAAAGRAKNGQNSLYRMGDTLQSDTLQGDTPPAQLPAGQGLAQKHGEVRPAPIICTGKTFADIAGHAHREAIEALAARAIFTGKSDSLFAPEGFLTRAEFAAIITRGLGLSGQSTALFADVPENAWYAQAVGVANAYGIIEGRSNAAFDPQGTVSRQEAAVMVARAAQLCGLNTTLNNAAVRDMLAQFSDYRDAAEWAQPALAFCYRKSLLSQEDLEIRPLENIKRGEAAELLYRMLNAAQLL